jgi:hypothetical protein
MDEEIGYDDGSDTRYSGKRGIERERSGGRSRDNARRRRGSYQNLSRYLLFEVDWL